MGRKKGLGREKKKGLTKGRGRGMASSRNYRPRPIDVRKIMPIMRDLHLPPVPRPEDIGVEGDDRRGGSAGS